MTGFRAEIRPSRLAGGPREHRDGSGGIGIGGWEDFIRTPPNDFGVFLDPVIGS